MGSDRGNQFLGAGGAAIPAVIAAQPVYFDGIGRDRGVDVTPFFKVLDGAHIPGTGRHLASPLDTKHYKSYFDEMFLGRLTWRPPLRDAQAAANAAAER